MTPKKGKLDAEIVISAINSKMGNISAAAAMLGVTRQTLHNYVNRYKSVKDALDSARETMLDNVESALYREVLNGNVTAMIFWLKTQGKRRGWVERHEHSGADGGPVLIQMTWGDTDAGDGSNDAA